MTGNGLFIPPIKMVMKLGMVYDDCFTHIIEFHLNPYKLPYNAMGSFALKSGWSLMSFWYLPMAINFRMAAGYGTRLFYAFKNNQRTQQTLAFSCCFYPTATISTAGPGSHFRFEHPGWHIFFQQTGHCGVACKEMSSGHSWRVYSPDEKH